MNSDAYLKLAEVEDRMWYIPSLHWHVRHGLERGGLVGAADVLDAGCGTGGLVLRLRAQRPAWRWTGIDFSALGVELAALHAEQKVRRLQRHRQRGPSTLPRITELRGHVTRDSDHLLHFGAGGRAAPGATEKLYQPGAKARFAVERDVAAEERRAPSRVVDIATMGFGHTTPEHAPTSLIDATPSNR
jgi:SAM-dependent methyltransferase